MATVTWKRQPKARIPDPYTGKVTVHGSPCYDFIVSLRALYNPRTFVASRSWAAAARRTFPADLLELGAFYFQGSDTALGYGALRLVPHLGADAPPAELITALKRTPADILAGYMLDTGEVPMATLQVLERAVRGVVRDREVEQALHQLPPVWAKRCRRVLSDPTAAKADLIKVMDWYRKFRFDDEVQQLAGPIQAAVKKATGLLAVLRTSEAVEQLLGGYTLSEDLDLERITLAPSVFIYPFMSSRVDERAHEAVIVFGVRRKGASVHGRVPDEDLLDVLKAMADHGRLKALTLLAERSLYGPDLVRELGVTQPTVHHHVSQLRAAGLVRQERTARGMRYSIRQESVREVVQALTTLFALEGGAPTPRPEDDGRSGRQEG